MIALDIAGAFDCVWHQGLMAKLEQLGITGDLLHLFSSYLTGRNLHVVVSRCTSAWFRTKVRKKKLRIVIIRRIKFVYLKYVRIKYVGYKVRHVKSS